MLGKDYKQTDKDGRGGGLTYTFTPTGQSKHGCRWLGPVPPRQNMQNQSFAETPQQTNRHVAEQRRAYQPASVRYGWRVTGDTP